ncbi:MAG: phosphomannomutase/phosphoglucomutase [Chloroflexota bacterium]|nr:phosphomannomutase/phosphoglucomutase [Chloroflexota bacterium]
MTALKKTMFRAYDIRGRVSGEELNEGSMELIAKGYGTMLRRRGIPSAVVGYDARESSEAFHTAFERGLLSTGIDAYDIGLALSPMMYWAQYHYQTKGGAMITASHNPSGWNGLKLTLGYSYTTLKHEIDELYGIILRDDFARGEGEVLRDESIDELYAEDLVKHVSMGRPLKVVLNAGNGTAGPIARKVFERAGCEVVDLHCEIDMSYPHYFPNPSLMEMMEDTGQKVREVGADIGVAIDGDGDRIGTTDEQGEIVWPDRSLILLARQILKRSEAKKIVFDVKCSQALPEDIEAHGGEPVMWKTGHSWVKNKCHEIGAAMGGEMSGHIFIFDGYYGFDDAVFAGLRMIEYLSNQDKSYSELISNIPHYFSSPTLHVDCADEVKYEVASRLAEEFKKEYEVVDIDGARILFGDGWGLVRASSNLPVLVLRFEAQTPERLEEIKEVFRTKFKQHPEIGDEWYSG